MSWLAVISNLECGAAKCLKFAKHLLLSAVNELDLSRISFRWLSCD